VIHDRRPRSASFGGASRLDGVLPGRIGGIRSFELRVGEFIGGRSLLPPGAPLSPDTNGARAPIEAAEHLRAAPSKHRNASRWQLSQREDPRSDHGSQPAEPHSEPGESHSESAQHRTR